MHTHIQTYTHKQPHTTFNLPMHTHARCAPTVAYITKYLMKVSEQLTVFCWDTICFIPLMVYLCWSRETAAGTPTGLWSHLHSFKSRKKHEGWREEQREVVQYDREQRDALAATDCSLLTDCSPLGRLMCCYCSGISHCFPEVIWECRRCWISVSGCCGRVAAAAGGRAAPVCLFDSVGCSKSDESPNWQHTNVETQTNVSHIVDALWNM